MILYQQPTQNSWRMHSFRVTRLLLGYANTLSETSRIGSGIQGEGSI